MKNLVKISVFSVLCVLVWAFISCEVGLGDSVDTTPPTMKITYPPSNSVIKGAFTLAGTSSDDQGISKVVVTVYDSEGKLVKMKNDDGTESESIQAVVEDNGTKWRVSLNKPDVAGNVPLPDGTYKFSAVATDTSGRTSNVPERSFDIDNTPPLFIISSPAVTDADNATEYGSVFSISGKIADNHSVRMMNVSVSDKDGKPLSGTETVKWNFTNIETSGGTNITAARYSTRNDLDEKEQNLHANYSKIYNVEKGGDQIFTCSVELMDSAHDWNNPVYEDTESIPNSTDGNKTTSLWLNDDIYEKLMGANSQYKFDISDIKKIWNGAETNDDVLNLLKQTKKDTASQKLAFSLNKDASPTYSIGGYDMRGVDFEKNSAAKNGKVTFMVKAGRNGTLIKPSTLKLYLFGPFSESEMTNEIVSALYDSPQEKYSYYNTVGKAQILYTGAENASSVASFTETVKLPDVVEDGMRYVFVATGSDQDGLTVVTDGNYYGFVGISAGTPPKISILSPESDDVINSNSDLVITGTASSNTSKIKEISYIVSVSDYLQKDENGYKKVGEITGSAEGTFGEAAVFYTCAVKDGVFNGINGDVSANPKDGEIFVYEITVTARDESGLESKEALKLYLDNEKPGVSITNVDSVAVKASETEKGKINGTVIISGKVSERNLSTFSLEVKASQGKTEPYTVSEANIEQAIDTTQFSDGEVTFTLSAVDEAGNKGSAEAVYIIDQNTDKPVIKFNNGKDSSETGENWDKVGNGQNVFNESNNTLIFMLTDDDGLKSATLTLYGKDGRPVNSDSVSAQEGKETPENPITYSFGGSTTASINYILPKIEQDYKVVVEATDSTYTNADGREDADTIHSYRKTVSNSYIRISESNLIIKLKNADDRPVSNDECTIKNADVSITGTLNVTAREKVQSIERFAMKQDADGNWQKDGQAIASYSKGAADDSENTITISLVNGQIQWTDKLSSSDLSSAEKHFYYLAKNTSGNSTYVELVCHVDGIGPVLKKKTHTDEKWYKQQSQTLEIIVKDEEQPWFASGIDEVKYTIGSGETASSGTFARGASCDANGDTNKHDKSWTIYRTTIDSLKEGPNEVKVTASDAVGNNAVSSLSYNLKIDTQAPEINNLTIDSGKVYNKEKSISINWDETMISDSNSGISKIEFATNPSMSDAAECSPDKNLYVYPLNNLSDGIHTLYVRVTDNAGNKTDARSLGSFTVDSTAPVVSIKSPVSNTTVNKTISLSGTVSDNNLPESGTVTDDNLVLEYKDGESWTSVSESDFEYSRTGQNWTISGFDTTKLNSSETAKTFTLRVTLADSAGNTGSSETTLIVDQNSDRPVITLKSINCSGSTIKSNSVMGLISDDDGDIQSFYRIDTSKYTDGSTPKTDADNWEVIAVESGTGSWTVELDKTNEGRNEWYFYVIDSEGETFCTKDSASLSRMYISDRNATKDDNMTGVSFDYDETSPEIQIAVSRSADFDVSDTSLVFGGDSKHNKLYVKATVTEAVAMDSTTPVVLSVGGESTSVTWTISENKPNYVYISPAIDISNSVYKEGSLQVSVTAKDAAGWTNRDSMNITVDKSAPTVKIVSPSTELSAAVTSAVTISGTVLDKSTSVSSLKWTIPKVDLGDDNQDWKEISATATWEIIFASGAPDSSDSLIYYVNAKDSNENLVYKVVPEGSPSIFKVPIWFMATDSVGNSAILKEDTDGNELYVLADADGGKPRAWINSPENGNTTNGLVTVYGGASDDVSVKEVHVQIDADNDGDFDSADYEYIYSRWDSTKDGLKDNLKGSGSGTDWYILASGTNSWKCSIDTDCIPKVDNKQQLRVRVRACDDDNQTRDWPPEPVCVTIDGTTPVIKNLKLVQYGKGVSPDANSKPVSEREYISGMYISNASVSQNGEWYLVADISDNVCVSEILFSQIQSQTDINISLGEELIEPEPNQKDYKLQKKLPTERTGVISYKMTAKDETAAGETSTIITIIIDNTPPSLYDTNNTERTSSDVLKGNLRLKSQLKMLGTDDKSATVVNNNNYFTFGDTTSESGSGLAYIAFYFERQGSSESRVYNPMFKDDNKTLFTNKDGTKPAAPASGNVYINEDGLAAMYISGIRPSEDSITLLSANSSIRKGGLIKIAGAYSLVTEVSGTTVKFSPTVSKSFTEAELILAQVVDHQLTESMGSDGSVMNDDGDGMVETISRLGAGYTWTASIDSNNIPDGPIIVHVTVIDNAGNVSFGSISTKVENNRPRIAKVLLGTDLNGNGDFDWNANTLPVTTGDSEKDTKDGKSFGEFNYYSALNTNTEKAQPDVTLKSSAFKVIDELCIIPEFVGGNNGIGYIVEYPTDLENAKHKTGVVTEMDSEDIIKGRINKLGTEAIDSQISDFGGIIFKTITNGHISLTFWDKTEETQQGTNSQWALLKIPVTLLSDEKTPPDPRIRPFYWKSSTENSVFIDNAVGGHIELEADLTEAIRNSLGEDDPKVSGKIKVEGTIYDNVRLSSISANVFGAEGKVATYNVGTWSAEAVLPKGVISFSAKDIDISQSGHTVQYTMVVDTEQLSGAAGKDTAITVTATDWKRNTSIPSSSQTTNGTDGTIEVNGVTYEIGTSNYYKMDVVPYVTEIVTNLSSYSMDNPSVYARSSVGSYPVYEGEEIEIKGYNIGTGIASVTMNGKTVTLDSSNKLTVDSNVSSGTVSVSVNSIPAVNNINKNNAVGSYSGSASDNDYANCYNRQPNGVNNNLLTDDLSLDVWNFKTAASPIGSSANYVHMKVGPYLSSDNPNSGRIGFSFKNAIGYFNMPGQKSGNGTQTIYTVTNNSVDLYVKSSLGYVAIHHWGSSDNNKTSNPVSLGSQVSYNGSTYYHISFSSSDLDITSSGDTTLQFLLTKKVGEYTDQTGNCMITSVGCYVIDSVPSGTISPTTEYRTSTTINVGNKVYSQTRFGSNFGGFNHNTFAFDKNGYTYGAAQAPDTSGQSGMSANFQFFSRAVSDESGDFHGLNFNYYNATNARRIENTSYYKGSTVYTDENRVQNPEMATYVNDSTSYVYLAYYDHGLDMIKFRVGSVGSSANSIGLGLQDLDGSTSYRKSGKTGTITSSNGGDGGDTDKIAKSNGNLRDSLNESYKGDKGNAYLYVTNIADSGASPYVAVGALPSDGTAVVVWYDKNVQALKMKSAAFSSVTSTSVSWTDRGTISSVGGKYVSMAIDEAGGVHLAYLSNSGANLYYTYMSSVSATPVTMLVDAYQDVGDRCMITVGRESTSKPWIPYISYKSNYASHTKIAYPVFADDADAATMPTSGIEDGTEKYTGAWNVSLVPDTSLSIDDTVSIGVNKDWASNSGVMHKFPTGNTQTASDIGAYALCDATIVYGNGTKNPVMGYAIEDGSIQMAQKK